MKKSSIKIIVLCLSILIGTSLFFVACNNDEETSNEKVYNLSKPETSFFYNGIAKKVSDRDAKFVLECSYINMKDGYSNEHLSQGFDKLEDACNHMQNCIEKFPDTKWYNITINGKDWNCPCFNDCNYANLVIKNKQILI